MALALAMHRTEYDVLHAESNSSDKDGKRQSQRMLHHNPFIEMLLSGVKNEQMVNSYYELLMKADKFIKTATPHKMALAGDKHGSNYGLKDQYGRRWEHYGFFDEKHRHSGKTIAEVIALDLEERRTKDDDYELLQIYNNKPIEVGFSKVLDVVEKIEKEGSEFEYQVVDVFRKSKQFRFPIKAYREDENIINKIEQLTEFLHVKKIGFEFRQLEFFIPLKFKTEDVEENSEIFLDITNFTSIFVKDDYGKLIGYGINKFIKRIRYNDTHEVWKFEGIEMQDMGAY